MTGEWVWSSEEEGSGASSGEEAATKETLPVNTIEKASSDEEAGENEEYEGQIKLAPSQLVIQAAEQNVPINLVLRLRYVKSRGALRVALPARPRLELRIIRCSIYFLHTREFGLSLREKTRELAPYRPIPANLITY